MVFHIFSNAKKVKLGKIQKMSEKNHKKPKEKKNKGLIFGFDQLIANTIY